MTDKESSDFYEELYNKSKDENIQLKFKLENYRKLPEKLDEVLNRFKTIDLPITFKNGQILVECDELKVNYNGSPNDAIVEINGKECDRLCSLDIHISANDESTITGKFFTLINDKN